MHVLVMQSVVITRKQQLLTNASHKRNLCLESIRLEFKLVHVMFINRS